MKPTEIFIRFLLRAIGEKGREKAVTTEASAIRYIKNPSETVQQIVIRQNPLYIEYIETPSKAVQSEAISMNSVALLNIKNPDSEIAMLAKLSE